ncbi:MAG TPA: BTAD domain-containing putative transcriptional regulator [Thermomicrobiales bacterium]|nr:BTAD domain-containing putative transcriptional regulator [Thermomicrobiales bacterium]
MALHQQATPTGHDRRAAPAPAVPAPPAALRVTLLGGFRVALGAREVDAGAWGLHKAADLVKLLALAPGHALHREQLLEALWPDRDPASAANGLRYALHIARRALEGPPLRAPRALHLRDGRLELRPAGGLWVDVAAFEAAAAAARGAADPAAGDAALALYAGDLLPEDRYADWAADRREALCDTYLGLLVEVARRREARGERAAAIAALERALAAEPAREEAHAGLMRLYAATGRRDRALRQYARLRAALRDELDAEPDPATQALYHTILARVGDERRATSDEPAGPPAGDSSFVVRRPPLGNLRAPLTSLIGRAAETAAVTRLLTAPPPGGARLVTLTGTGGCGKTRLALAVAGGLATRFLGGVWLVELAGLRDPAAVPLAVATALGIPEEPGRARAAGLAAALRDRAALLVLDNCEHLVAACAELAVALLGACPALRLLATSREALRVPGERAWRVPSLPVPAAAAAPAALAASAAARLFADRVRWHHPDFAVDEANAVAVAAICRRLDGLPLALELAAARAAVLTPEQLAARLDDALGVLAGGSRTAPPRQRTLRATLDWSHALLDERERALLRRLAVFAGGWTLAAAEAVCAEVRNEKVEVRNTLPAGDFSFLTSHFSFPDVLGLLAQLVDKSLVQVDVGGAEGRYRLLEPVRQYAAERLAAGGEAEAVAARHAAHYLALAEAAAPALTGPGQAAWLARLDRDHDNLRAALRWALDRGDAATALRLGGALWRYWGVRWHSAEGLAWLEAALALPAAARSPLRAPAALGAGVLAMRLVDCDHARALLEEALALARAAGDRRGCAWALIYQDPVLGWVGDYAGGRARAEEALALFRAVGDKLGLAQTLNTLAEHARFGGDDARAAAYYAEALALERELGDRQRIAVVLHNLGYMALHRGDPPGAARSFTAAYRINEEVGYKIGPLSLLEGLAAVAGAAGAPARAARLYGAWAALCAPPGTEFKLHPPDQVEYERYAGAARAAVGETAWAAAWAAGGALPLDRAVAEALAFADEIAAGAAPPAVARLSPREREIAALVARGLTNRQVAAALDLAPRTVDTHVANLLHKLGLTSRDQVAARLAAGAAPRPGAG